MFTMLRLADGALVVWALVGTSLLWVTEVCAQRQMENLGRGEGCRPYHQVVSCAESDKGAWHGEVLPSCPSCQSRLSRLDPLLRTPKHTAHQYCDNEISLHRVDLPTV